MKWRYIDRMLNFEAFITKHLCHALSTLLRLTQICGNYVSRFNEKHYHKHVILFFVSCRKFGYNLQKETYFAMPFQ